MAKKQKQIEIPNIDDTPLAQALAKAVAISEEREDLTEEISRLDERTKKIHGEIIAELLRLDRTMINHKGFKFRVKRTQARSAEDKLVITKICNA